MPREPKSNTRTRLIVTRATKKPAARSQEQAREEFFDSVDEMNLLAQDIRAIEAAKTGAAQEMLAVEARLKQIVNPLMDSAIARAKRLYEHAKKNGKRDGHMKHVAVGSGTVAWALSPPAVKLKNPEEVLQYLIQKKKDFFLHRPPAKISRTAMLLEPEQAKKIPGVSIVQDEKVYVRPGNTMARAESTLTKKGTPGKWKLKWPEDEESEAE